MTTPEERLRALTEVLEQRILVLDGAMGTMLQQRDLTAEDFGGASLEGCNENLVRTRPDVVLAIHRAYFERGLGRGGDQFVRRYPIVLRNTACRRRARAELAAARLARQAADGVSTSAKPRFVAGPSAPPPKRSR